MDVAQRPFDPHRIPRLVQEKVRVDRNRHSVSEDGLKGDLQVQHLSVPVERFHQPAAISAVREQLHHLPADQFLAPEAGVPGDRRADLDDPPLEIGLIVDVLCVFEDLPVLLLARRQRPFRALAVGDVSRRDLDRRLSLPAERNDRQFDVDRVAVVPDDPFLEQFGLAGSLLRPPDPLRHGFHGGLCEERCQRPPLQFGRRFRPDQDRGRFVGEDQRPIGLDQDGIGRRFHEQTVARLAFTQVDLGRMLVQRHFDGGEDLALLERLQHVAERIRDLGPLQGGLVRVRRQVDDRAGVVAPDDLCRFHPVHVPLQRDVHQDQVGTVLFSSGHRILAGAEHRRNHIAHPLQTQAKVARDDAFVFDDEDPCS